MYHERQMVDVLETVAPGKLQGCSVTAKSFLVPLCSPSLPMPVSGQLVISSLSQGSVHFLESSISGAV